MSLCPAQMKNIYPISIQLKQEFIQALMNLSRTS